MFNSLRRGLTSRPWELMCYNQGRTYNFLRYYNCLVARRIVPVLLTSKTSLNLCRSRIIRKNWDPKIFHALRIEMMFRLKKFLFPINGKEFYESWYRKGWRKVCVLKDETCEVLEKVQKPSRGFFKTLPHPGLYQNLSG